MSHFTKVETKINDLEALKKALDQLGWKYRQDSAGVSVRGWRGQTAQAELAIDMGSYDVGLVKNEAGAYELEADWWGVETTRGLTEAEIVQELNQKYAYQRVIAAVQEAGYSIDADQVAADGSVQLNVSKWG